MVDQGLVGLITMVRARFALCFVFCASRFMFCFVVFVSFAILVLSAVACCLCLIVAGVDAFVLAGDQRECFV